MCSQNRKDRRRWLCIAYSRRLGGVCACSELAKVQQTVTATQAVFQSDLAQLGVRLSRLVAQMDSAEAGAVQALQAEVSALTLTEPCWVSAVESLEKASVKKCQQCEARKQEYESARRAFLETLKTVKEREAGESGQQDVERELETARKRLQLLQDKQKVRIEGPIQCRRSIVRSTTWDTSGTSLSRTCWRRREWSGHNQSGR